MAEFLPAIGETGITQRDCCSYVIVPKCVTTQAPQGFFEGVTHGHWWLFCVKVPEKMWQRFANRSCRPSE